MDSPLNPPLEKQPTDLDSPLDSALDSALDVSHDDINSPPDLSKLQIDEVAPPLKEDVRVSARGTQDTTRARAEEVNSGCKVVPKIEVPESDYFGVVTELEAWFTLCGTEVGVIETALKDTFEGINGLPIDQASKIVLERAPSQFDAQLLPTENVVVHFQLFLHLCQHIESGTRVLNGVELIKKLMEQAASLRWMQETDHDVFLLCARIFMLIRMCFLATFGNHAALKAAQVELYEHYDLKIPEDDDEYASPVNYAMYMCDVGRRYPAFERKRDKVEVLGAQLAPNVVMETSDARPIMPYVPVSIVEACELFKSRVRPTPQAVQLHEELQRLNTDIPKQSSEIQKLYQSTLHIQKSFVQTALETVVYCGQKGGAGVASHAALTALNSFARWLEVSHVLMFEHLMAVLFDCQLHFVAQVFCQRNPSVMNSALSGCTPSGFSEFWEPLIGSYFGPPLSWSNGGSGDLVIRECNLYSLQTYVNLMALMRMMTTGKTKRMLVVAELPIEPFKELFNVYHAGLWREVLELFKAQVPFTGKRWRYLNIELISAIYLYCPPRIDDTWLSGNDLTYMLRNAASEEEELRRLIKGFNHRLETCIL